MGRSGNREQEAKRHFISNGRKTVEHLELPPTLEANSQGDQSLMEAQETTKNVEEREKDKDINKDGNVQAPSRLGQGESLLYEQLPSDGSASNVDTKDKESDKKKGGSVLLPAALFRRGTSDAAASKSRLSEAASKGSSKGGLFSKRKLGTTNDGNAKKAPVGDERKEPKEDEPRVM